MLKRARGSVMMEHILVSVFLSTLLYYALVGANNWDNTLHTRGALSGNTSSSTGRVDQYFQHPEYHNYPGLAQSLTVKQRNFTNAIYQP